MELGEAGVLEEDHWMMEVNLGIWKTPPGNRRNDGCWPLKPRKWLLRSQEDKIKQRCQQEIERGINI